MPRVRYQKRIKAGPHVAGIATPVNTVLPVITGDTAGETSTTSDGTWTSADAFTYQWYLDGVLLAGETTNSIDTDEGWVGQTLTVVVCGGGGGGMTCVSAVGVVLQEASSYTGPLDLVPSADWVYAGSVARALGSAWLGQDAVTIRKVGGATQSFAADAVTGEVPVASITTFLGGAEGRTVTLLDQSGDASNATQADPDSQPVWTASAQNSKPGMVFDTDIENRWLATAAGVTFPDGQYTVIAVVKKTATFTGAICGENFNFGPPYISLIGGLTGEHLNARTDDNGGNVANFVTNGTPFTETFFVLSAKWQHGASVVKFSNAAAATTDSGGGGALGSISERLAIGDEDAGGGSAPFTGTICEIMIAADYLSDANILSIAQNMGAYFNITLS